MLLDGEFGGVFPSGNSLPGGDFAATFTLNSLSLAPPTNLVATAASSSQIALGWSDNSAGETGFKIERATGGAAFSEVAIVPSNLATYTDANLSSSTPYSYRVRSYTGSGNSSYSNVADATTLPSPGALTVTDMAPAPGVKLTAAPKEIVLTLGTDLDPDTVTSFTVRLIRAGADGTLGTSDDVAVTPKSVSLSGSKEIKVDLSGVDLADDAYRVVVSGTETAVVGAAAHWTLDEGSGTGAQDSSGNGHHGVVAGPVWTTGKLGKALHFNGSTDRIVIGATEIPPPWTAAMWVRRTDSPNADSRLMDSASYPVGGSLRLEQYNQTNKVGFTQYGAGDYALSRP